MNLFKINNTYKGVFKSEQEEKKCDFRRKTILQIVYSIEAPKKKGSEKRIFYD